MEKNISEGDWLSLNGSTGEVYEGKVATMDAGVSGDFGKVMGWADKFTRMKVRTNADSPADAQIAREFGAQGIGLCRTEHMFFEGDRIKAMREMILAKEETDRRKALDKLLPYQRADFEGYWKQWQDMELQSVYSIRHYTNLFLMKKPTKKLWPKKWE